MATLGIAITGCSVKQDSAERLQAVWQSHLPQLQRLSAAMCLSALVAEDVLQDVYVIALERQPPDLDELQLRRWLFRVTINRCHLQTRLRRRWRDALLQLFGWESGESRSSGSSCQEQDEVRRAVRKALRGLPEAPRAVLVLKYYAEFDATEISRILGMPAATVRSHLRRGRLQLAEALASQGFGNEQD